MRRNRRETPGGGTAGSHGGRANVSRRSPTSSSSTTSIRRPASRWSSRGSRHCTRRPACPAHPGLGRRVSTLTTPEQFAALIAEALARASRPRRSRPRGWRKRSSAACSRASPGDAHLIAAKELKVQEQLQGNRYVGIHIQLSYDEKEKRAVIQELVPGGPADRAGGTKGDRIEQIDGVDTQGMKLAEIVDRLRGPVGTELVVTVRQPKEKEARTLKMTRETLFLPTVVGLRKQSSGDWDLRVGGPDGVAYLKIQDIAASTPHELRKLAQQFDAEGLKALILDLRGLSNASLHPTVLLADSLLERGTIGRVRTADRVDDPRGDAGRPVPGPADRRARRPGDGLRRRVAGRGPPGQPSRDDRGDPDRRPLPRPRIARASWAACTRRRT